MVPVCAASVSSSPRTARLQAADGVVRYQYVPALDVLAAQLMVVRARGSGSHGRRGRLRSANSSEVVRLPVPSRARCSCRAAGSSCRGWCRRGVRLLVVGCHARASFGLSLSVSRIVLKRLSRRARGRRQHLSAAPRCRYPRSCARCRRTQIDSARRRRGRSTEISAARWSKSSIGCPRRALPAVTRRSSSPTDSTDCRRMQSPPRAVFGVPCS